LVAAKSGEEVESWLLALGDTQWLSSDQLEALQKTTSFSYDVPGHLTTIIGPFSQ
jgi:hypothetical protein